MVRCNTYMTAFLSNFASMHCCCQVCDMLSIPCLLILLLILPVLNGLQCPAHDNCSMAPSGPAQSHG